MRAAAPRSPEGDRPINRHGMQGKAWSVLPLQFNAARTHVRLEERAQRVPTAISADLRAQITEASVRADWRAQGVTVRNARQSLP